MIAGVTTGTLAILAAQPTDVVKVRMQAAGNRGQYKVLKTKTKTIAQMEKVIPFHAMLLLCLRLVLCTVLALVFNLKFFYEKIDVTTCCTVSLKLINF